ncbi:VOC family protein [Rugamonas apoptosis]|uniref:VOC family protein n=1 Tax=Rugamonas apoptosis TaxID=2758570 RepID=A0A7W2F839_9BURK|nr:VOC family protein [Rugamonas apoptosis]MBA5686878.1 VOC family protein [Rugamonas apoptosis]
MANLQRITPCLWFDGQAEDAVQFYTSIFNNAKITSVSRYGEAGQEVHGQPPGSVMVVAFELDGVGFTALNGGPQFHFNEALSLQINCDNQQEVDYYWGRLTEGGDPNAQMCGWLKDKFGLSWQIVPTILPALLMDADAAKAGRVMQAMLKMKKLDIMQLRQASAG